MTSLVSVLINQYLSTDNSVLRKSDNITKCKNEMKSERTLIPKERKNQNVSFVYKIKLRYFFTFKINSARWFFHYDKKTFNQWLNWDKEWLATKLFSFIHHSEPFCLPSACLMLTLIFEPRILEATSSLTCSGMVILNQMHGLLLRELFHPIVPDMFSRQHLSCIFLNLPFSSLDWVLLPYLVWCSSGVS